MLPCLCRAVQIPGSSIVHAPEQCGKTSAMAALALVSSRLQSPVTVIVKDVKGNAEKVAGDLSTLLEPFDIDVCYVSSAASWQTMTTLGASKFKQGKLVLVMCAYTSHLDHLNDFLAEQLISGNAPRH